MLQNEYVALCAYYYMVAKFGFDTIENEPLKIWMNIHSLFNPLLSNAILTQPLERAEANVSQETECSYEDPDCMDGCTQDARHLVCDR